MKHKEIFSRLVENAFDFLKKAIQEFENSPKFSVIHFYSAIELFIKARLMREHWTLIVSKKDVPDIDKFLEGKFHSVTLQEANSRLHSVTKDGISQQELKPFQNLGEHRNKMVHFFHRGQHSNKEELAKIISEQCQAWYFLHRLLTQQWRKAFLTYQKQISEFNREMQKYQKYLSEKFSIVKPEIEKKKDDGIVFLSCPSCGFDSFQETEYYGPIFNYNCETCGLGDCGLKVTCPECDKNVLIIGDSFKSCQKCNYEFNDDVVTELISAPKLYSKETLDQVNVANCGSCDGYETVVSVGDGIYFCISCFEPFSSQELSQCDFCGAYCCGPLENSYLMGCSACDGKLGWDSDKD